MAAESEYRTEIGTLPELPGVRVVHLEGNVRHAAAAGLRETLLREVSHRPPADIVVELSGVSELDTSGAAVLVEALRAAHTSGVQLLLCAPSESVLGMFRLAGFAEVLGSCCTCADDARRRLGERGTS